MKQLIQRGKDKCKFKDAEGTKSAYNSHKNRWTDFCKAYNISEFDLIEDHIIAFLEHEHSVRGNGWSTLKNKCHGLQSVYSKHLMMIGINIPKYPWVKDFLRSVKRLQGGNIRDLRTGVTGEGIIKYLSSLSMKNEPGLVASACYQVSVSDTV